MPAPTTADELLDLLQKSNLVDEPRLKAYVQKLRDATTFPPDPNRLAQFLVRDALLSYFQAEQLLQGKYKRFTLGKYKVLEKLGSGGMGTVFLCEHKLMRRRVAVKVLPVPKSEDRASDRRRHVQEFAGTGAERRRRRRVVRRRRAGLQQLHRSIAERTGGAECDQHGPGQ